MTLVIEAGFPIYIGKYNNGDIKKIDPSSLDTEWTYQGHAASSGIYDLFVDKSGCVYSASSDKTVHKIAIDGTVEWTFTGHNEMVQGVAVDDDGNVYSASGTNVFKLDSDGEEEWEFDAHSPAISTNGIGADSDGNVYFVAGNIVFKLDSDGVEEWTYDPGTSSLVGAMDSEGFFYYFGFNKNVEKLKKDGTGILWSYTHANVPCSLSVGNDNYVYAGGAVIMGTGARYVTKLDTDGNLEWSISAGSYSIPGVTADKAGYAYFVKGIGGAVTKLDSDGVEEWSDLDSELRSVAVELNATVNGGSEASLEISAEGGGYMLQIAEGGSEADVNIIAQGGGEMVPIYEAGSEAPLAISAKGGGYKLCILTMSDDGNGTAIDQTDAGPYAPETEVSIKAEPATGYEFSHWAVTGGHDDRIGDPHSAETTFTTPPESVTLTANFTKIDYTLTVESSAGGAVTEPAEGVHIQNYGDEINIKASPDNPLLYEFDGWEATEGYEANIDDPTNPETTFTMPADDVTVKAVLKKIEHTLTIESSTGGTVEPEGALTRYYGQVTAAEATPEERHAFVNWMVGASVVGIEPIISFVMPAEDTTLAANFVELFPDVTFRVKDTHGNLLPDAVITFNSMARTTGSAGTYTFEQVEYDTYTYSAGKDGYISQSGEITVGVADYDEGVTVEITLEPRPFEVEFIVSDSTGAEAENPVPGATVKMVNIDTEAEYFATTNTQGVALFAELPAGMYDWYISRFGYYDTSGVGLDVDRDLIGVDRISAFLEKMPVTIDGIVPDITLEWSLRKGRIVIASRDQDFQLFSNKYTLILFTAVHGDLSTVTDIAWRLGGLGDGKDVIEKRLGSGIGAIADNDKCFYIEVFPGDTRGLGGRKVGLHEAKVIIDEQPATVSVGRVTILQSLFDEEPGEGGEVE